MKPTESCGKKVFGPSNWELYKELEVINFKAVIARDPKIDFGVKQNPCNKNEVKFIKNVWTVNNDHKINGSTSGEQNVLFLKSMKVVILLGQCLGLNPVMGILQTDLRKMRFQFLSWKCLYSLFVCAFQVLGTILNLYSMCKYTISIFAMAYVSFYATTSITTILFIRIAKWWPRVVYEISRSQLDEYVDHRVKIRCSIAVVTLLTIALFEHVLAHISLYAHILDCTPKGMLQDPYNNMTHINFFWLFEIGVPYSLPLGIFIQIMNTIVMINWHYSDMFIICVSLYLISIFDKINEKIESAFNKACQPWVWRSIREDYTRATRLVRLFDDVISGVIFVSFANNLFFICLQLYNVLQHITIGNQQKHNEECPNFPSGPFYGFEYVAYYTSSLSVVISRFLAVSLLASRVHSAAVQPATILYGVPTEFYCTEMQRFIEQIHSGEVALSGLQFFHVTKSLVLSVAGTIVTYELVLLQFDDK